MINIISSFGDRPSERGPGKVFANLIKGLEKIGYPYVVNMNLDATKRLWIHDSVSALYGMQRSSACKVAGPNLFLLPTHIPRGISLKGSLYLQPSDWAKRVWEAAGFTACPIRIWPVGIDAELFRPSTHKPTNRRVLIYHKQRDAIELQQLTERLDDLQVAHTLIMYGKYTEEEYRQALGSASFVLWHGCHESQGVALQEALASDVPVLVWDVTRLSQSSGGYRFPEAYDSVQVSSAPYFDDSCGVKIHDLRNLPEALDKMQDPGARFAPRDFVTQHLSLEGQARAFVGLWEEWGLSFEAGLREVSSSRSKWRAPIADRIRLRIERRLS